MRSTMRKVSSAEEIGHQIKLRHVPDLVFKIDRSMEYGRHISKIIDELDIDHSDDEGNSL